MTDPGEVKGLLALGGPEESSGYKGYGLAMMVEILCGILSGKSIDSAFLQIEFSSRQSFWSMGTFMESKHDRSKSRAMFYCHRSSSIRR